MMGRLLWKNRLKKTLVICIFFLFAASPSFAQTRDDVRVYIPTPVGGTSEQQFYFYENFRMETEAAGYAVTDDVSDADYILNLAVKQNIITYDDGYEELAPEDEPQNVLTVRLTERESGVDIVQFDFPFDTLPEMYEFNLFLLYQAMANVPLTKLVSLHDTQHWRNKWLYLRTSVDFNVPAFIPDIGQYHKTNDKGDYESNFPILPIVPFGPGVTLGLELQFLNWMAIEADIAFVLGNVESIDHNYDIVGTFDFSVKFPIKPPRNYMIEPFAGIAVPMALVGANVPHFGVQGGIQIASKAGEHGGFFANFRAEYDFSKTKTIAPDDKKTEIRWQRFVITASLGYKLGFINRFKDD